MGPKKESGGRRKLKERDQEGNGGGVSLPPVSCSFRLKMATPCPQNCYLGFSDVDGELIMKCLTTLLPRYEKNYGPETQLTIVL